MHLRLSALSDAVGYLRDLYYRGRLGSTGAETLLDWIYELSTAEDADAFDGILKEVMNRVVEASRAPSGRPAQSA